MCENYTLCHPGLLARSCWTGRPGTRRGHLGALDGMSRPSRPPAPRSQHIGTERPATKCNEPEQKHQRALNASYTNGQGLANQTGQHDGNAPGQLSWAPRWAAGVCVCVCVCVCKFEPDRPCRPLHAAIWWPGQSLQPRKDTHTPSREASRKQGLEAPRRLSPGGALGFCKA